MRQKQTFTEYRVGPRTVLQPGDKFRASGGPFYELDNGQRLDVAEHGTFTFHQYVVQGARSWIEAYRDGSLVILNVGKRYRSPVSHSLVKRPYKIRGKVGATKREKATA